MDSRAVAVGIVFAVLAGRTATPAAAASHPCRPPGSKTIVENRWVRVYLDEDYYACSFESRKTRRLAFVSSSSSGFSDADTFTLAGRFVAYRLHDCAGGGAPCFEALSVIDMGRLNWTMGHGLRSNEDLGTIVLKENGSIAYTYSRVVDPGTREEILRRRDRRGRALLANGIGDRAPRDLRLIGSTLYWREGERERTKTLR
jgi:hypothetical protein